MVSSNLLDELDDMSADTWDQNLDQFALGDINSSLETLELAHRLDHNNQLINILRSILKGRKKKTRARKNQPDRNHVCSLRIRKNP